MTLEQRALTLFAGVIFQCRRENIYSGSQDLHDVHGHILRRTAKGKIPV